MAPDGSHRLAPRELPPPRPFDTSATPATCYEFFVDHTGSWPEEISWQLVSESVEVALGFRNFTSQIEISATLFKIFDQ